MSTLHSTLLRTFKTLWYCSIESEKHWCSGLRHDQRPPRGALVTYVHTWRTFAMLHPGVDFVLSTFESWRRSVGHYPGRKLDLVAVMTELVAEKLQQHATVGNICNIRKLSNDVLAGAQSAVDDETAKLKLHSQCWLLTHTSAQAREWDGFPLVHDILHVASERFKRFTDEFRYDKVIMVCLPAVCSWVACQMTLVSASRQLFLFDLAARRFQTEQ